MLVVRFVREKEGEAEITKGNVPVKTEHREKQREVLYLITSILDAEGKGGFIGGDIIHRQNRKLVLTDKADNAIEQVTASK